MHTTTAKIDTLAEVRAEGDVLVVADAFQLIVSIAAGASVGGLAGIGGSIAVFVLTSTTNASIGNAAKVQAGGNVLVHARDRTITVTVVGNAGVAGIAGIGLVGSLAVIVKKTSATVGIGATVDALGDNSALGGIINGATGNDFGAFRGVAVQAESVETLVTVAIAAGGGVVGVAGAIALAVIISSTAAEIQGLAQINTNTSIPGLGTGTAHAAQAVNVTARNTAFSFTFAGTLAAGVAGVAGAIDAGIMLNKVTATIGAGAIVHAKQDISVNALGDKKVISIDVAVGVGGVAIGISLALWAIGAPLLPTYLIEDPEGNDEVFEVLDPANDLDDTVERDRQRDRRVQQACRTELPARPARQPGQPVRRPRQGRHRRRDRQGHRCRDRRGRCGPRSGRAAHR